MEKQKKITIKDVIYWVAESWDNVKYDIKKSWKKLLPDIMGDVEDEQALDETGDILQMMKQLPVVRKLMMSTFDSGY
jgi:hypothetical protein